MEYRKFGDTYVVRMDKDEEIVEQVKTLALAEHIRSLNERTGRMAGKRPAKEE